jgi:acetyl esterase
VEVGWELTLADGVPVRVYHPRRHRRPGHLVWAHGGSWIRGSAAEWHRPCLDLAARSGVTVVNVDYRLAPGHPCPAALHDVTRAVDWTLRRGGPVAVGGDSAGATLAAGAALTMRDRGVRLAAQVLAYPPMDPECRSASYGRGTFPRPADMRDAWTLYLGARPDPYATPLAVGDLAGCAPALIGVGELDPVADDARAYAERLDHAAVPVRLQIFPGMGHAEFLRPGPSPLRAWIAARLHALFAMEETKP